MTPIELQPLGSSLPVRVPPSFAVRVDIVGAWDTSKGTAYMARVCAAAVGVCLRDGAHPRYSVASGQILAYGAAMLDYLMGKGVTLDRIAQAGSGLIPVIAESLPKTEEVDNLVGFTDPSGASSTA